MKVNKDLIVKKYRAAVKIVLDTRIRTKEGTYAVKLRVTYRRAHRYFPIKIKTDSGYLPLRLTVESFGEMMSNKPPKALKERKAWAETLKQKAAEIIGDLPEFTFEQFETAYYSDNQIAEDKTDVIKAFNAAVAKLAIEGRFNTSQGYHAAKNSFEAFRPNLKFADITPDLLNEYQSWMERKGASITTTGIYLRYLRVLVNEAIESKVIATSPFGRKRFSIPTAMNIKKALSKADVQEIASAKLKNENETKARDFWILTYLLNGINFKDLANLKHKDVDWKADKIQFIRAKTRNTSKTQKKIEVPIHPKAKEIIERWGNPNTGPNTYVLPILDDTMTEEQKHNAIKYAIKTTNANMKKVGKALGIEGDFRTYAARHSFATVLLHAGASTELIRESMGHQDIKTTESYLKSFGDEAKKQFSDKLL